MVNTQTIVYATGLGAYGASAIGFTLWGTIQWARRHENPSHLIAWAAFAYTIMYAALFVDATSLLRTGDGVEYPFIRPIANAIVNVVYAWLAAAALWMPWGELYALTAAAIIGGVVLGVTDASPVPEAWYAWAGGMLFQLAVVLLLMRRCKRSGTPAWLLFGGALVWFFGMPVIQALSWTLGGVLDKAPHRTSSEIAFLVVSGVGIILYGAYVMLSWAPVPKNFTVDDARAAEPPAVTSENVYMAASIDVVPASSLRHRVVR